MRKGWFKKAIAASLAGTMMMGMAGCGSNNNDTAANTEAATTASAHREESTTTEQVYESPAAVTESEDYSMSSGATKNSMRATYAAEEYVSDGEVWEEEYYPDLEIDWNTNEYNDLAENSWQSVKSAPLSTFGADVDTAAYSQIRSGIMNGYGVDPGQVRIEEMINYFQYDYETPTGDDKFAVHTEFTDCPWNEDTQLALVSLNTEKIDFSDAPESNIVFLIDTSGSMFDDDKLPLVQKSMCMLAENLTEKDRVSIVTYAGSDEVVLEGASGADYNEICEKIEGLEAYGSTNGSAGIKTAYELAEKYFIKGGNNRVILATDGDLNVGVTSETELEKLITEEKETGVFLSVIGVGYGNYKDNKLETLADKGNGNYSYIDSIFEAKKALVTDLGATMLTVAKDVKLQVEFNPALVKGYRLIGYENRTMAAEDFNDDKKDGGEMGAGHSVTAIYEIVRTDSDMDIPSVDMKYSGNKEENDIYGDGEYNDELFTLRVRYKEPDGDKSKLLDFACKTDSYSKEGSDNIRWAAAVAAFGMYLKDSEYMGDTSRKLILRLANSVDHSDDDYRKEFIDMVETYFDELD